MKEREKGRIEFTVDKQKQEDGERKIKKFRIQNFASHLFSPPNSMSIFCTDEFNVQ